MAAFIDIQLGLFRQIETINRPWIERLQQARAAEADLFTWFMERNDPGRVISLWNTWLLEQTTELLKRNQRLAKTWVDFYADAGFRGSQDVADSASAEAAVDS
ncbi:hypothetical protein KXS07_36470 [Inquilinus limosus]|uniref:hypothetical protein n=1 Tax=Inquilinus limosus TaxID=171674 RepID=UPI003F192A62